MVKTLDPMTDKQATKEIARLTAKLARKGRKDLADKIIELARTQLGLGLA
jgi:hypothetical protein